MIITGVHVTIVPCQGYAKGMFFQGWQVNVFVHENYATNGDPTMRKTAKP